MRLLKASLSIVLLCLIACNEQTRREMFPPTEDRANQLTYVKDGRTGLCFVHNSVNNGHGFSEDVFTNVPCTPEVEFIIRTSRK